MWCSFKNEISYSNLASARHLHIFEGTDKPKIITYESS